MPDKAAVEVGATSATFEFVLEGVVVGHFQSVSGLQVTMSHETVAEGGANTGSFRTLPGQLSWDNLVLSRVITVGGNDRANDALLKWAIASPKGKSASENQRPDGAITLLSRDNKALTAWKVKAPVLVRWTGPNFDVGGDDVLVEEIEIAHEGLEPHG